jgi:NADH:ubiquinone oxidoreductase subunit 4 (subunit M)
MMHRTRGRWDVGAIVFGGILLFVGAYYLLRNTLGFNLDQLDWEPIWPVLVILLGVAVLYRAWTRRSDDTPS